jgi:O-acetyl-ADP-ribose deacetylase (regulator of RNase III)
MIEVVQADLATIAMQGVIRPVAAEWTAVTPSLRRLDPLLGDDVEEQCRRIGELPVGTALVTSAGGLGADLLIHVIVRSVTRPVTEAGVARGLQAALRRADEWGIAALATPPLGLGAGNLDAEESADVMVPILVEWQRTDRQPHRIAVVVESGYEQEVFERALRQAMADTAGALDLPLLDP